MSNKIIYPNYKPSWHYDNFDLSKVGNFVTNLFSNVADGIWGLNNLKNGTVEQQQTEQMRLQLESERNRSNTIIMVGAMIIGAICLVLIFKK